MEKDSLSRILIRSAADKWLRDIETDPKRTVRRLIDMGRQFAKGSYQHKFFKIAAGMLENENSAYYDLVSNLVRRADHDIIKEFGFNLGYNSWTSGAETIRRLEKELGYNIPWNMTLEYDAGASGHLPLAELNRLIREGRGMGVFTYFVRCRKGLPAVLSLCQNNPDCGFIVMLYEPTGPAGADALFETKNVIVTIPAGSGDFSAQAELMSGKKLLYGVQIVYSGGDEEWISDSRWQDEFVDAGCFFVLLDAAQNCPDKTQEAVKSAVSVIRNSQNKPLFLADIAADTRFVDEIISDEPCGFSISSSGLAESAANRDRHMAEGIKGVSLASVMNRIMPKLGYTNENKREDGDKKAI